MKTVVTAPLLALALLGCSHRYALLTVPAISMTETMIDKEGTRGEIVTAEYCQGDDPVAAKEDYNVGMIDEAVAKAQRDSGAKYLADATIYRDGSCVAVEGTAVK